MERLEDRTMMAGDPALFADDIADDLSRTILEQKAWTPEELSARAGAMLRDPSFPSLAALSGAWKEDREAFRASEALQDWFLTALAGTPSPSPDAAQSLLDEQTLTLIARDVAARWQSLAEMEDTVEAAAKEIAQNPPKIESPAVTATVDLLRGTADGNAWTMELPGIGGKAELLSWKGKSAALAAGFGPASAQDIRRALIANAITPEQIAAVPPLGSSLGFREGYQNGIRYIMTVPTAALGTVTVQTFDWKPNNPDPYRYIVNRKGVVTSSEHRRQDGQNLHVNEGRGKVTLSFPPKYVQWVDIAHTNNRQAGTLFVTGTDGRERMIPVGGNGPVLVDAVIAKIVIEPSSVAAYGIRRVSTAPVAEPQVPADAALLGTGGLMALDLRQAGKMVTAVELTVHSDRPADAVTAVAYRGKEELERQIAGKDGRVQLQNDGGITSVLFSKSDTASSLLLRNLRVTGWKDQAQPAAPALNRETNDLVAYQSSWYASTTDDFPYNYEFLGAHGIPITSGRLHAGGSNGALVAVGKIDDVERNYVRHEIRSATGVWIVNVQFQSEYGVHLLPQTSWKRLSGNAVITFPGTPKNLVFFLGGAGAADLVPNAARGKTLEDAMPPAGLSLQSDVLVVNAGERWEGWMDVPTGVPSKNFHPVGGGMINVLAELRNDGTGSGDVTVRIHAGPSGTVADPVQKEFRQNFGPLFRRALAVNVHLARPGDTVTIETIGPDGVSSSYQRKIHGARPDEMSQEERDRILQSRRIGTLQEKIKEAVSRNPALKDWKEEANAAQAEYGPTADFLGKNLEERSKDAGSVPMTKEKITYEVKELLAAKGVTPDALWKYTGEGSLLQSGTPKKIEDQFIASLGSELKKHLQPFSARIQAQVLQIASRGVFMIVRGASRVSDGLDHLQTQIDTYVKAITDVIVNALNDGAGIGLDVVRLRSDFMLKDLLTKLPSAYTDWLDWKKDIERTIVSVAKEREGMDTPTEFREFQDRLMFEANDLSDEGKVFQLSPSVLNFSTSKPLLVLVLGNSQSFVEANKDDAPNIGKIFTKLQKSHDIVLFRVGDAAKEFNAKAGVSFDFSLHTEVVLQHTKNILSDILHSRGIFQGKPTPTRLVFGGYSFGAGTIDRIMKELGELQTNVPIAGTAYIDGVMLGTHELGRGVTHRPQQSLQHMHVWQDANIPNENDPFGATPVHGASIGLPLQNRGNYLEYLADNGDYERYIKNSDHLEIDQLDDVREAVELFLRRRLTIPLQ